MRKVLIAGLGPAGLSAAFNLFEHDLDITIMDRLGQEQHRRYHSICGGGISKKALIQTGFDRGFGIINEVSRTKIVWPDGTEIKMRTPGYILDRPVFIEKYSEILKENGVKIVRDAVTCVSEADGGYDIITASGRNEHYNIIIGADGCCSTIRKCLFKSMPELKVPATEFLVDRESSGDLIIRLCGDGSGTYTWEFPHGSGSGTGGMKDRYDEPEYLMKGSRFIPVGGVGKIVKGNAYLIGDAAAMANPISYGGLKAALLSGKKAAESIMNDRPEAYQKWWDRSILSDRRFMDFNKTLRTWSEDDLNKAVRPFRHGGIYLPGIWACITQPKNINMYFGCLFAFKYGW